MVLGGHQVSNTSPTELTMAAGTAWQLDTMLTRVTSTISGVRYVVTAPCVTAPSLLGKGQQGGYVGRMLKRIAALSIAASALVPVSTDMARGESFLGQHSDWEAFSDKEAGKTFCYVGSEPTKMRGKYKKRGDTYIIVTHRPAEKSQNVVSIRAGYTHKASSEVEITVGKTTFKLFTKDGWAFTRDSSTDNALVKAMVRGTVMTVKGISGRGTKTTDTYSLKGFTAAYRTIGIACKV